MALMTAPNIRSSAENEQPTVHAPHANIEPLPTPASRKTQVTRIRIKLGEISVNKRSFWTKGELRELVNRIKQGAEGSIVQALAVIGIWSELNEPRSCSGNYNHKTCALNQLGSPNPNAAEGTSYFLGLNGAAVRLGDRRSVWRIDGETVVVGGTDNEWYNTIGDVTEESERLTSLLNGEPAPLAPAATHRLSVSPANFECIIDPECQLSPDGDIGDKPRYNPYREDPAYKLPRVLASTQQDSNQGVDSQDSPRSTSHDSSCHLHA